MSPEPVSSEFYKGPAYALVIGISEYQHGKPPGQELKDDEFPNLRCAAQDAQDVAAFLTNNGFIEYNVTPLINQQATRGAIKEAFEALRIQCKRSGSDNPLVIIYFSGHGIADADDDEGRHYLVPYDACRDKLVSTALENGEFRQALETLKTTRLVVFLDACHAGAFGQEGARGVSAEFVPAKLGEGSGRYIIASCGPKQRSWEWKDPKRTNGIFTWHLLDLLKCQHQDFAEEQIDIFTLFPKLRDRVKRDAASEHDGVLQEPIGDIQGATGIVLAINQHARQERLDREKGTAEKRRRLLDAVLSGMSKVETDQLAAIRTELRSYVLDGTRRAETQFDDFYGLFDQYLPKWEPDVEPLPMDLCRQLAKAYKYASPRQIEPTPTTAAPKVVEPATAAPKAVDKFVELSEKTQPQSDLRTAASPATAADKSKSRRQLSVDDRDYLLADIRTEIDYVQEATALDDALRRPINEAEFTQTWHRVRSGKEGQEDDQRLDALMGDVMTRFRERWPKAAQALDNASAFAYRAQK